MKDYILVEADSPVYAIEPTSALFALHVLQN